MSELFQHRINNDMYQFRVVLYNADGKAQRLAPTGIKSLVIEDDFYDFYHKGYIIIDNRFDAIERSTAENVQTDINAPSFIFMGDARDWISIDIFPVGESGELDKKEIRRHSEINFQAAIYNVEEIATDTPDVKFKKLYFWDKYYEYLREKNVSWSTAEVIENRIVKETDLNEVVESDPFFRDNVETLKNLKVKNISNFTDFQRAIPTGEALKKFLAAALPEEDKYPALFPSQNFNTSGEVTTDAEIYENDLNWDLGSTSVFYSCPARFKAIDGISFILNRHVSNADTIFDQSFLKLDRAFRCFTFRPLSLYFKNAFGQNNSGGPLYIETVMLGGYGYSTENNAVFAKVADFTPKNGAFKLLQTGASVNFALEPPMGLVTQKELVTRIVHSYDTSEKEFRLESEFNSIKEIMNVYQRNYVDSIKPGRWSSIVPGINRLKNKNVVHNFSTVEQDPLQRLVSGRNRALYTAIFGNNQVKFKAPGSTLRQSGRFVGLDRDGSSPANEYDQKFLGIYFVTEVKHIFEGNNYYNEVTCIKTYTDLQIYKGQVGPNGQNISNQITI